MITTLDHLIISIETRRFPEGIRDAMKFFLPPVLGLLISAPVGDYMIENPALRSIFLCSIVDESIC